MMKEQRRYSPELKAEAVKMVVEQGLTQQDHLYWVWWTR